MKSNDCNLMEIFDRRFHKPRSIMLKHVAEPRSLSTDESQDAPLLNDEWQNSQHWENLPPATSRGLFYQLYSTILVACIAVIATLVTILIIWPMIKSSQHISHTWTDCGNSTEVAR